MYCLEDKTEAGESEELDCLGEEAEVGQIEQRVGKKLSVIDPSLMQGLTVGHRWQ
jgi:hypothetical protein